MNDFYSLITFLFLDYFNFMMNRICFEYLLSICREVKRKYDKNIYKYREGSERSLLPLNILAGSFALGHGSKHAQWRQRV